MSDRQTPLCGWHEAHGAKMVPFAGWTMPVQYGAGILREHLATRRCGGLFDVSHMGRFRILGGNRAAFLQHALSNDAEALAPWRAQYTLIPNERGGLLDDAYLYRWGEEEWLLVVNAGNADRDIAHLGAVAARFGDVRVEDATEATAMIAFQGPLCAEVLEKLREAGRLPDPARNSLSGLTLCGRPVRAARTGYTGEPVGFELFMAADAAAAVWDGLHREGTRRGMLAAGLGARDTLRLEARMPLYGHELGADPEGREMPAFAFPLARAAVSFAERKGDFIGRDALALQLEAAKRIADGGAAGDTLPRRVLPLAVLDPGVARRGDPLFRGGSKAGVITSGTTVPYWEFDGRGAAARITGRSALRAIALACVDSSLKPGDPLEAEVRGRRLRTLLVGRHGRGDVPPFFQPELAGATGG